jgi:hypothetical protein
MIIGTRPREVTLSECGLGARQGYYHCSHKTDSGLTLEREFRGSSSFVVNSNEASHWQNYQLDAGKRLLTKSR